MRKRKGCTWCGVPMNLLRRFLSSMVYIQPFCGDCGPVLLGGTGEFFTGDPPPHAKGSRAPHAKASGRGGHTCGPVCAHDTGDVWMRPA